MRLSEQLADAMVDAGHADQVDVFAGQFVVVRTRDGSRVAEGFIDDLDPERGIVRLRDVSSGTDWRFDVDTKRYTLWIRSTDPLGQNDTKAIDIFVSQPGKKVGEHGGEQRGSE